MGTTLRVGIAIGASFLASACVTAAPPYLLAPTDPSLGTRPLGTRSVTADLVDIRPVSPKDWRELNRAVAPQGGAASSDEPEARPHEHHGR